MTGRISSRLPEQPVRADAEMTHPAFTPAPAPTIPVSAVGELAPLSLADRITYQAPTQRVTPRSWRNNNPGNLRPAGGKDKWLGQTGVDTAAGGPFSIFHDRTFGWRALTVCLLTYRNKYGLRSVRAILTRYAPDMENDTKSYVAAVAGDLGVRPTDTIDVTDPFVMRALLRAIADHEGGRNCPAWPDDELVDGMRLAGLRGP